MVLVVGGVVVGGVDLCVEGRGPSVALWARGKGLVAASIPG